MSLKHLLIASGALLATSALGQRANAQDVAAADTAQQDTTKQDTGQAASSDANLRNVVIKVKSVDKAHHMVTFSARVSPEATLEKSGQPIRIDQLKAGDEVRAAFDPNTGEVMKLEIKKGSARSGSQSDTGSMK